MKYINQLNAFMDRMPMDRLSCGQQALWFALMHQCNRSGWAEWIAVPNSILALYTGMTRQGIEKARNVLKQKGYIEFSSRGTKSVAYHICQLYDEKSLQVGWQDSWQAGWQDTESPPINNYIDKTIIERDKTRTRTREKFVPPSVDEVSEFIKAENININATAERFVSYNKARGWKGITDWKAAVRSWAARDSSAETKPVKKNSFTDYTSRGKYDLAAIEDAAMAERMGAG